MVTPSSDREQLLLIGTVCLAIALLGPAADRAGPRILLAYGAQGYTMARTLWSIRHALRQEFGKSAQVSILVPGAFIGGVLLLQALRQAMTDMPALQSVVQRSLMVRLHQQALASACERFHPIGQRLARWLLMSQDRAQSDHFHVTHEGMATMLGVRRVGVTLAASELQDSGLIRYHRGELTVLDRTALEGRSCSCYATDRALHRTLFPAQPA